MIYFRSDGFLLHSVTATEFGRLGRRTTVGVLIKVMLPRVRINPWTALRLTLRAVGARVNCRADRLDWMINLALE